MTPEQRKLRAKLAAERRWSRLSQTERSEATRAARDAFDAKLAAMPNPAAARAAHMTAMRLAAAKSRSSA